MLTKDLRNVVAFMRKRAAARRNSAERCHGTQSAGVLLIEAVELACLADAIESGEYIGASEDVAVFERELWDGWRAKHEQSGKGLLLYHGGDLGGWAHDGVFDSQDGGVDVPVDVMHAFLSAYREWSLQQPEGSPDRAEWEKAQ